MPNFKKNPSPIMKGKHSGPFKMKSPYKVSRAGKETKYDIKRRQQGGK